MDAACRIRGFAALVAAALLLCTAGARAAPPTVEELLWQQGTKQYKAHDWPAAAITFQKIAGRPTAARRDEALFYAGESCVQAGRYGDGAFLLAKSVEVASKGPFARQARFRLVEASYFAGDYAATVKAAAEYRSDMGPTEKDAWLLPYVGRAAWRLHEPAQARKLLAESLERFPEGPLVDETRLYLGKSLAALGEEEAAVEHFAAIAEEGDASLAADALLELARHDWKHGRTDAALARATELERRFPQSPALAEARLLRDVAAWLKKPVRNDNSWHTLLTRVQKQPGGERVISPALLNAAAKRLQRAGREDAALVVYDTVIESFGRSQEAADALLTAAEIYESQNERRDAAARYEQFARDCAHSPRLAEGLMRWAALLVADGKPNDAERLWQRVHEELPESSACPAATLRWATAARRRDDRETAGKLAAELASRPAPPDDKAAREILAAALLLQAQLAADAGRWSEIAAPAARLTGEFPATSECDQARFLAADAALRLGRPHDAAQLLESLATQTRPLPPGTAALVELRRAQLAAGQKEWQAALDRSASVSRERLTARQAGELAILRGRAMLELGQYDAARGILLEVRDSASLAASEEAAMAAFLVGETFFRSGQDSEAIQAFLKAEIVHEFPTWRAASLLQAARCYERLGRRENALKLYARLVEQYPQTPYVAEAARRLSEPSERTARAVSP